MKLFVLRTKLSYRKVFHRKFTNYRNKKNSNTYKPVQLGLSILDLNKTIKYFLWYDYVKGKYDENARVCYMDTASYILTSNYELETSLPKGKNNKVMGVMKDVLRRKIMKILVGLREKVYTYLKDEGNKDKKQKTQKNLYHKI